MKGLDQTTSVVHGPDLVLACRTSAPTPTEAAIDTAHAFASDIGFKAVCVEFSVQFDRFSVAALCLLP